jgi:UrcA family protein
MKNLTALIAVTTFAVCNFTIARADTGFEPPRVTVRFADLDTTTTQGAAVLYRRLKSAAESVCQDLDPGLRLAMKQRYNSCIHLALGNAIVRLDRPAVTAYAAARGFFPGEASMKIANNK